MTILKMDLRNFFNKKFSEINSFFNRNWPFMTTHTWGENPRGKWRLVVRFQSGKSTPVEQQKHHTGWLKKFSLMLHGTKEAPYVGIEVNFL